MKKIICLLVSVAVLSLIAGCSPRMVTLHVHGVPGTKIMDLNNQELGVLQSDGSADIRLVDNNYHGMLLAQEPSSGQAIPFALDYNPTSGSKYSLLNGLYYTFMGISIVGLAIDLGGLIMLAADGDPTLFLIGNAIALPPVAGGFALEGPLSASTVTQCYQYKQVLETNTDLE